VVADESNADRSDGTGEGNIGDAEGRGGSVDAEDIGIVDPVGTEEQGDDLGVIKVSLGEKGAKGAVRHPAGEDLLFGGAAFTFEITTRETARGSGLFLVFDREREP